MMVYGEPFLRSVNLTFDADEPHRVAHYVPTTKCVPLIEALYGREEGRAFLVVAPYGSGKSLTALYVLNIVEKQDKSIQILKEIRSKLKEVSPDLANYIGSKTRDKNKRGLTITLHGHIPSLPQAIKDRVVESLKRTKFTEVANAEIIKDAPCNTIEEACQLLKTITNKFAGKGIDRIVVLWDEFGKHLESLLVEGRPEELLQLQTLAEFVSRNRKIPITLGLFLHQGLLHYAGNMTQSVRNEWTKIEGRFETIQYVDDSKEIYRLIGDVVSNRRNGAAIPLGDDSFQLAAAKCKEFAIFPEFSQEELYELFKRTYPLTPVTTYLLPRISARVAQNERTLFNFIYNCPFDNEVYPWHLFDYFAGQMRADIAVGGTYKQWLETQSALSKVGDKESDAYVLKTACLLGLGLAGDRSKTGRSLLDFATTGYLNELDSHSAIEGLIERKLLLYRKYNDEVSVWHGTDLDLRGKLDEEKNRQRTNFDLLEFLSKEAQPSVWRPNEYNSVFGVRRYLLSEYHNLETIEDYRRIKSPHELLPSSCDGKVLFLVLDNHEDLQKATQIALELEWESRIVFAVPKRPVPLFETALEVYCLNKLQLDTELIGSDPMALPEIQQMTEDARSHLEKTLAQYFVNPGPDGPYFYNKGERKSLSTNRDFSHFLSLMMLDEYPQTPIIHNELIVRKKPSGTIVNSRKKLVIRILEGSGSEDLEIKGKFPDYSMFRTILLNTGLYSHQKKKGWAYSYPDELGDDCSPGLRNVWFKFHEFFTVASGIPKNLGALLDELRLPPFGVREGLFPIFFAAGYKAFPQAISIRHKNEYIEDLSATDVENICKTPEFYDIEVFELSEDYKNYLQVIWGIFKSDNVYQTDLVRKSFEALEGWLGGLPAAWETTNQISRSSQLIRDQIAKETDPVPLFFKYLPNAFDDISDLSKVRSRLKKFKEELEGLVEVYRQSAFNSVTEAFNDRGDKSEANDLELCLNWAMSFPEKLFKETADIESSAFIETLLRQYDDKDSFIEALSFNLIGVGFSEWEDITSKNFSAELRRMIRIIEDFALSANTPIENTGPAIEGVARLAEERIAELANRLSNLAGKERTKSFIKSILSDLE